MNRKVTTKPKKIRKMAALTFAMLFTLAGMNIASASDIADESGLNSFITGGTGTGTVKTDITLSTGLEQRTRSSDYEITLVGDATDRYISGGNSKAGFVFGDNSNATDVTIQNLILKEMNSIGYGAAIRNVNGNLDLMNMSFTDNQVTNSSSGGAIYHGTGEFTLSGTNTFTNNTAYSNGGAIYNSGTMSITDTNTFTNNTATNYNGGAINNSGTMSITGTNTFTNNTATNYNGGAIGNNGIIKEISGNSTFTNNKAALKGGAIYNKGTIDKITGNSTFDSNIANSSGGAIFNNSDIGEISNTTFTNNVAEEQGGAICNSSNGTIKISGTKNKFTNNHAEEAGGAIFNLHTISQLTADFTGNYTTGTGSNKGLGGAITNYANANITSITGSTFKGNGYKDYGLATQTVQTQQGGAIYNLSTINEIKDTTFDSNGANYGGAIYNDIFEYDSTTYLGTIDEISNTTFSNNVAKQNGGAIYNTGTIGEISNTTFTNNEATNAGGAIFNLGAVSNITANFVGNNAAVGGAISTGSNMTITNSNFEGNGYKGYIDSEQRGTPITEQGGAIFNGGTLTISNATFKNNVATTLGGAIANGDTITLKGTNTFTGNKANDKPNDITNIGTLNIENGTTTMDGGIDDAYETMGSHAGTSNINGGTLKLNDGTIVQNEVNVNNGGTLAFGQNAIAKTATTPFNNLYLNGGTLNIADGNINTFYMNNVTLSANSNLALDADLANETIDKISVSSVSGSGNLNISNINLLSDATKESVSMSIFADETTKTALSGRLQADLKDIYYSPIYKYNAKYDGEENIVFTRFGSGSSSNDYNNYNPSVLASSVGAQVGAYLTQINSYEQSFANMDMLMNMTNEQRTAMKYANKYASTSNQGMIYAPNQIPEQEKGLWFRPYATFEKVDLSGGPNVESISYGTLLGGDSELKELSHGWDFVWGAFAGYNGSHQNYEGNSIYQNGGTLGLNAAWYKGNFFTGLTANVGASNAQASTMYGSEDFTMLMTGVASKTGYNWELFNGKFIIQPSYMMSYSFVNTFDYTNAKGVAIDSDPLHAIQIVPGIKFIGNLKNGWQPYLGVQMVWNIMDKSKFYANDVTLPQMSVDPYVQYGVGLQKRWGDRFTCFAQAMIRNGGRTGIALSGGFRWALGNNPSQGALKQTNSQKPELKKTKVELNNSK